MHRSIHSPTQDATRPHLTGDALEHGLDCDTSGPMPIGDLLPKLRLRVRTIPTIVWRDGAWRMEWIVLTHSELIHAASRRVASSSPPARRRA